MSEVHILDRERAVKALARRLAEQACYNAEGYGWNVDDSDDVDHFYPTALRKAERYMEILEANG